jgi:hypothetical protein
MELLHSLIHRLSEKEIILVKNYLNNFSTHKGKEQEETLAEKLFNFLLREPKVPFMSDCSVVVYCTARTDAKKFQMLKSRLRTKILEAINSEMNLELKETLQEIDHESVRLKKKAAQMRQLFYSKPGLSIIRYLLDEIISGCKKYEFYAMLIEHLEFKKYRFTYKKGSKAFDKLNKEIERYGEIYKSVTIANDYYCRRLHLSEFGGKLNNEKVQKFLQTAITELKQHYEKSCSAIVRFYLS